MDSPLSNDNLNVEELKKTISTYAEATEINTTIIDNEGSIVDEFLFMYSPCEKCRKLTKVKGNKNSCKYNCFLNGSYEAKRFENKYVFFCSLGLSLLISPIFENSKLKASIICGPVNLTTPDDILIDMIYSNILEKEFFKKNILREIIYETNEITTNRANSILDTLSVLLAPYRETNHKTKGTSNLSNQLNDIYQYIDEEAKAKHLIKYPFEKEKEFLSSISLGNKKQAQKLLNDLLGYMFFSEGSFETIKVRALEFIVLISRASIKGGGDTTQILPMSQTYISELEKLDSIEDIVQFLSDVLSDFTENILDMSEIKDVNAILRAVNYIKENYMNKITLDEVASHVYMSSSHFSRIFKKETKLNYNYYLNYVRIENSKELLLNENIPLINISHLVGFDDQSYFTNVFKKFVGVSPGKYRKQLGRI